MRFNPGGTRAYTYRVTVEPATLPIELATVKSYLKIPAANTLDDDILLVLMGAATDFAEEFTRRDFITRTYQTFRDYFPRWCNSEGYYACGRVPTFYGNLTSNVVGGNMGFELKRSPLQTVISIEYLVDNVITTVPDTTYYNTIENDFSEVLTLDNQVWPDNADRRLQSIIITFTAGFGDTPADMPDWLTTALLQHIAMMYENRGDCVDASGGCACSQFLPITARAIYQQHRILIL